MMEVPEAVQPARDRYYILEPVKPKKVEEPEVLIGNFLSGRCVMRLLVRHLCSSAGGHVGPGHGTVVWARRTGRSSAPSASWTRPGTGWRTWMWLCSAR